MKRPFSSSFNDYNLNSSCSNFQSAFGKKQGDQNCNYNTGNAYQNQKIKGSKKLKDLATEKKVLNLEEVN